MSCPQNLEECCENNKVETCPNANAACDCPPEKPTKLKASSHEIQPISCPLEEYDAQAQFFQSQGDKETCEKEQAQSCSKEMETCDECGAQIKLKENDGCCPPLPDTRERKKRDCFPEWLCSIPLFTKIFPTSNDVEIVPISGNEDERTCEK